MVRRAETGRRGGLAVDLSVREAQVLDLVAAGYSNRAIAKELALSERGVEKHITSLYRKLGVPADPMVHRRIRLMMLYRGLHRPA